MHIAHADPHRRGRTWSRAAFALGVALFLGVGAYDLHLPGPQYDEAWDAVPAVDLLDGRPPTNVACTRTLFGRTIPVMVHHHIGPTSTYLSVLGFALLGVSIESLRVSFLALGILTLYLLLTLARQWFDDLTAALAVLSCATAPAFIWWTRAGSVWTAPLLPITLGLLLLLTRWWRTGDARALVGAAFLFGLGFTTKILFIWLVPALGLTALLAGGPRRLRAIVRAAGVPILATALVALALGLAPFLIDNVPAMPFLQHILENAHTTGFGHDNLAFVTNLRSMLLSTANLVDGDTLMLVPRGWRVGSVVLVVSCLVTLGYCVRHRRRLRARHGSVASVPRHLRPRLFLLLVPATVLPASTVSTSVIGGTYIFFIVPLLWLLIASVLARALQRTGTNGQRGTAALALTAVLALVANHLVTNVAILRSFERTGGHGVWSDTGYLLARKLETEYRGRPVVAMDWGFARNLELLTRGRVRPREGFEYRQSPSPTFAETCRGMLADPSIVYLVRAAPWMWFKGYWPVCEQVAREMGVALRPQAILSERSGGPNTLIYSVASAAVATPTAVAATTAASPRRDFGARPR